MQKNILQNQQKKNAPGKVKLCALKRCMCTCKHLQKEFLNFYNMLTFKAV